MKKLQKLFVCLGVIVLTISVISVNAFSAARNRTQYEFKFDYISGGVGTTSIVNKDDSSYIYISCQSSAYPINVTPYGYGYSGTGPLYVPQGPTVILSQGQYLYLTNYIYENGFRQCSVQGTSTVNTLYTATGYWIPDSGIF